jgi:hypothetical protein
MLENEKVVLLVIGAVFFLIGLLGGGVEVSAVKIPTVSRFPRLAFLLVGSALLGLGVYRIMFPGDLGAAVPSGSAPSIDLPPTQALSAMPVDSTATSTPEPDLPPTASPTPPLTAKTFFSDDFETVPGVWGVGENSDEHTIEKRIINNGKYVWEITAVQPWFRYEYPDAPVVSDFDLQAEFRLVSGPQNATYGLVFRATEKGMYAFTITNQGSFMLGFRDGQTGEWASPIAWTTASAIKEDGSNILRVVAKGSNLQLFINEQLIGSISDSSLSSGKTGLTVTLYKAGDKALVEVDNFYLNELQE